MSTSYYYLREPITSVRVEATGAHESITVWSRHGNAGTLVVNKGDAALFLLMFCDYADDDKCPMRTHWGGAAVGAVVTENVRGLDPSLVLISKYGEPLTVGQIRDRAGAKRVDGFPTELFGYEENH